MKNSSFSVFIRILGRNKWFYLLSSMLFVGVIFLRALEPKIFQWLTDALVQLKNSPSSTAKHYVSIPLLEFVARNFNPLISVLLYFSALYITVTLSRSIVVFGANSLNSVSSEEALRRLRNKLFSHLQSISIHHYIHHSKGEIIQRSTNDLEVVKNFIQNNIVEVIRICFQVVFSFIIIIKINLNITLLSICLMPVVVFLSYRFYRKEKEIWEKHEAESDLLNNIIQENIQGIRTIKAYARESLAIQEFEAQNQRRLEAGIQHIKLHSFYHPTMDLVVFMQIVLSNLSCIYLTSKGVLTIGELFGIGIIINMMLWPLHQLGTILSNFSMAIVALQRIDELLLVPVEDDIISGDSYGIKGEIEFRNVSFKYPGQHGYALNNVSFKIHVGEKVAIIGPTGSGKSTIGKLLLRLYEPLEGTILIDKHDIKSFSKVYLRQHLGIALQNSVLFSASIKENMCTVNLSATNAMLFDSMEMASISSLLDDNESGLEKMIGEKGINLSGGQKQRMALARLLLKNPDVYILDDITSYIDEINEQAILKSLKKTTSGCTCIIISHKLSSILFADKIIALHNGSVEQTGTYETLTTIDGYFNVIFNLQTEGKVAVMS